MTTIAPKWASTIVDYLTKHIYPAKMSKVRQRYLHKHAQEFCIIANQLYHRKKDDTLRIGVLKSEYVSSLEHAHSSIPGGQFLAYVTAQAIL